MIAKQDTEKHLAKAEAAIAAGSRDPFHFVLAAWHRDQAGATEEAIELLQNALQLAPGDPVALTTLAPLLRRQGRLREAVLSCDAAIRVAPGYAPAWLERGFVLAAGGSIDAALRSYREAARLEPGNAAALAGIASIAARNGGTDEGRASAEQALGIDPGNMIAAAALSTIEIEAGETESAAARLRNLLNAGEGDTEERAAAFGLLGDALDKLGQIDDAFKAYARGKLTFAAIHARKARRRPQNQRTLIEDITAALRRVATRDWPLPLDDAIAGAAERHVFLLGYPRSGTTLVENIIASLPAVSALEERPTLREADQDFMSGEGILRLGTLDQAAARPYRQAYWARVAKAGAGGPTFVDMDPLKGIRLPIIARLFPDARVLIMRRDPRDVVLSCFRTNFALTSAAFEYVTLESAAKHYAALMELTELSLAKLPINAQIVRYDELVRNFDATTKSMCAFIGLPWSSDIRNFNKTAIVRGVATASAAQVRKPLYDGTRQWERYATHFGPALDILRPWVERYGFDN